MCDSIIYIFSKHFDAQVLASKKGSYVDGHEREDVVESRKKFLRRMVSLGFLNQNNAPNDAAKAALPDDLECPSQAEKVTGILKDLWSKLKWL